ncbi:MAG TPA: N-acetylglutaminylglutamine synthetase [Acidimicrobiales bacterium]|nr:N-acetylglutaminylglutamine synthetase [Acidimicrobiales bacterium]
MSAVPDGAGAVPGAGPPPHRFGRGRGDEAGGDVGGRKPGAWDQPAALSTTSWQSPPEDLLAAMARDVVVDMGWGRVLFGQTFRTASAIVAQLRAEAEGRRDICLYARDPQVLVAKAPQELFVDPSYTYRFWLYRSLPTRDPLRGVVVRALNSRDDVEAVNRIYVRCGMVPAPADVLWANHHKRHHTYLVAEDARGGGIVGTVAGIDHALAFGDPEDGTSLWTLAVDPSAPVPGVGDALVRALVERFRTRGRAYMDLSVMHDNGPAIHLYEKLGFERVPVFAVKRKNAINERLFVGEQEGLGDLNPYARIVADEALRRGVTVEVLDARAGEMRLSHGGRTIVTRESLSELTTAVAMSRCDDKRHTRRILARAGLAVPRGRDATFDAADHEFLHEVGEVVVKPARGEQGAGVTVGVTDDDELDRALATARSLSPDVLVEQRVHGQDLRIVVIGHEVVAAAVRRPASVVGSGSHTVRHLVEAQSRRRAAATGGESCIPLDDETVRTVALAGHDLDDVLPEGEELVVRRTANLHTGGTIHDVTAVLHGELAAVAVAASRALGIPVTGLDMVVPDPAGPEGVFIEANERPGLANHEPQPTAERFVDLLFPTTKALPWGWRPGAAPPRSSPGPGD